MRNRITRSGSPLRFHMCGRAVVACLESSPHLNKVPADRQRVLLLISETRDHGSVWARRLNEVVTLAGSSNTSMYALSFSPSRSNLLDTFRGNNTDEMHKGPDLLALIPSNRVVAANS